MVIDLTLVPNSLDNPVEANRASVIMVSKNEGQDKLRPRQLFTDIGSNLGIMKK